MKKLTNKEKEIMDLYWAHGPMFVKELLEYYDEPRPHFNTLSTMVRILEKEGYLHHKQFGNTYQYYPLITEAEYGRNSIAGVIKNYFSGGVRTKLDCRRDQELLLGLLPLGSLLVRQGREDLC